MPVFIVFIGVAALIYGLALRLGFAFRGRSFMELILLLLFFSISVGINILAIGWLYSSYAFPGWALVIGPVVVCLPFTVIIAGFHFMPVRPLARYFTAAAVSIPLAGAFFFAQLILLGS